jgi:Zn-finger nucleic acid-binding protein
MKCPNDQTTLLMAERNGIEIDYCPTCRGIWLDRGELDKLIASSEQGSYTPPRQERHTTERYHDSDDHSYKYKKHKKESFLGDLFDF